MGKGGVAKTHAVRAPKGAGEPFPDHKGFPGESDEYQTIYQFAGGEDTGPCGDRKVFELPDTPCSPKIPQANWYKHTLPESHVDLITIRLLSVVPCALAGTGSKRRSRGNRESSFTLQPRFVPPACAHARPFCSW